MRVVRANPRAVTTVAIARGGVASGDGDGTIAITRPHSLESGPSIPTLGSAVRALRATPDGTKLVAAAVDGRVLVLDGDRFTVITQAEFEAPLATAAIANDGNLLAIGHAQGRVTLATRDGRELRCLRTTGAAITCIVFDGSGQRIAVADEAGALVVLDLAGTTNCEFRVPGVWLADAVFLDRSEGIVAGCADGVVRHWSLREPAAAPALLIGHTRAVTAVAVAADGRLLSAGGYDRSLRVWDLSMRRPIATLHAGSAVLSLTAAADSDLVATGHFGHELVLWSTRPELGRSSGNGPPTLDTITRPPSAAIGR